MDTMRAVVVTTFGTPELVEVPVPEPGPGQVRIKVAAATVNPVDRQTVVGQLPVEPPVALGWDVAGVVDAVGPDVGNFSLGAAVVGLDDRLAKALGPYADFAVLDVTAVAPAPGSIDAVAAATLPLNAITAAQALDLADVPADRTLLVTGAAGAVGGFAVELAAARGGHVVALAGASDEAAVRGWGARTFVPRSDDIAVAVRARFPHGVDAVLDTLYRPAEVLGAVRDGGTYLNIAPLAGPVATERGIRVLNQAVHRDAPLLSELARLADSGRLTLRVAATFGLHDVDAAHELAAKSGLRGRVVLVP